MNTWLVSFQVQDGSVSYEHTVLLQGTDLALAEAACGCMGTTWWRGAHPVGSEGCYWTYQQGSVWLSIITLLSDTETETLSGLKFLDMWYVTGTPDAPEVRDVQDNRWQDFRN